MEGEQRVTWRKPSRSGTGNGNDNCVEVANAAGRILVRDSTDADGPRLAVPPEAWSAFLQAVRQS